MFAPLSTSKQLLGQKYCRSNKVGYPVWSQLELDMLRDTYEYPPYSQDLTTEEICELYSKSLPIPCMRGYTFSDVLGTGAGGTVYRLCYNGDATCQYVGKFIVLQNEQSKIRFDNEVDLMRRMGVADIAMPVIDSWTCKLPFFNLFSGVFEPRDLGIIISLLADASLNTVIRDLRRSDIDVHVDWLLQGLIDHGIMHRDLKMDNIVVYQGSLRLIDFGLAWDRSKTDVNVGEPNFLELVPTEWDPDYDRKTLMRNIHKTLGT